MDRTPADYSADFTGEPNMTDTTDTTDTMETTAAERAADAAEYADETAAEAERAAEAAEDAAPEDHAELAAEAAQAAITAEDAALAAERAAIAAERASRIADSPDSADFGPIIHRYTRRQAIEDGYLMDLDADGETKILAHEAGFRVPIAITIGAFREAILAGTDADSLYPAGQSFKGRLWDILMLLRVAIKARTADPNVPPTPPDRVYFDVMVDANGDGHGRLVSLWAHVGPGDSGEPVLTIMLEGED
jgi:hypothetical protein